MRRPGRLETTVVGALALAVAAGATVTVAALARRSAGPPAAAGAATPVMSEVVRAATRLGEVDHTRQIRLNLGLRGRDPAGLGRLLASGGHVAAADWAARFGPDPRAVQPVLDGLRRGGIAATWAPGSTLVAADGGADAVSRLLGVRLYDYRASDGRLFFAADRSATLPGWMRAEVTGVDGLDDFTRVHALRQQAREGMSPQDVTDFYNIDTLHQKGFDGRGETILLPGVAPNDSDLKLYTDHFKLPPLSYQAKGTLPQTSGDGQIETMLDLEVSHAIAPAASLMVFPYDTNSNDAGVVFTRMNDGMVNAGIQGAVVDESYGWCEPDFKSPAIQQLDSILQRGVALGMSFFISSGDEGAWGCFRLDQAQRRLAVALPTADPFVTSVGGTTVYLSATGGYGAETAWGEPVEVGGSGGGLSSSFPRPSWQTGPGVESKDSNGKRQIPDVAGLADSLTGWAITVQGAFMPIGGTSAAAPLWAGIAACINQFLVSQNLRRIGFANPALYSFGQNAASLPGPPLHDITAGNNLNFQAGTGWDFATGLGSPNVGALAEAWAAYIRQGGA